MPAMCWHVDEKLLFGNGSSVCDSLVVSVIVLRAFSIVCSERLLVGSLKRTGIMTIFSPVRTYLEAMHLLCVQMIPLYCQ